MSRVLLINPAEFETKYNKAPSLNRMVFPPLGLAYIAAVLEENDHKVSILDGPPLNIGDKELKDTLDQRFPGIPSAEIMQVMYNTSAIRFEVSLKKKDLSNKMGKFIYGNKWK